MAGNEAINETDPSIKQSKEPMVMPTDLDLVVVNMDKLVFEGKIKSLIAPGPLGDFAILPGHTPLFTTLKKGKLIIEDGKNNSDIEIEGGVAKITQYRVIILVGF